jgi:hypothetical protein
MPPVTNIVGGMQTTHHVICHSCLRSGPGLMFASFPSREEIEALTGRWRSDAVGWMCPACIRRTLEKDPSRAEEHSR